MRRTVLLLAGLLLLAPKSLFAGDTFPLNGQWRFALDPADAGLTTGWATNSLPDTIQLPGILEAQGYGDIISTHTPWVLSLYDHYWFQRADYAAYTNAGSVKVPFISQPPRHYLGAAWYQRDLDIPADWAGQHVTLRLERPHWKTTVWLDGREVGSDLSLCTPHEYDFGQPPAGRHQLTIRVDNRMQLPYRPDAHSVSDSLDNAWNGIVGNLELRRTPPVWIEDLQVYPHAASQSVTVRGVLGNLTGQTVTNRVDLNFIPVMADGGGSPGPCSWLALPPGPLFEVELPGAYPVKTWDEFHPQLYELTAETGSPDGLNPDGRQRKQVQFGFRDFSAGPNQFLLNGQPIYLRGTHFGGDFPLTGYPPTDVESWRKIFQTCKSWGLNHMRFHSWCPPEAAFTAADELGFYLQVECGMWNSFRPGSPMEKMLYSETDRILRDFGNHPSLMLVSASNEAGGNWQAVLPDWVKHYRTADPRHLYTPDTGWSLIDSPRQPLNGGADYLAVGRIGQSRVRGDGGWFGRDYHNSLRGIRVPVIAHELGQWVAYPDYAVIQKFTGFMQPGNFEIFRDSAAAHGLLAQNHEFAQASGRFQLECYQEEIEANLRTPELSGFQLLDLHDYTGQGTALIGLLDPFWQSKGYATPADFTKFCSPIVPLARLRQRIFTTADTLDAAVEMANFFAQPLTNVTVTWAILDATGQAVRQGVCATNIGLVPLGKNFAVGGLATSLATLPAPAQYRLSVTASIALSPAGSPPQSFENDWNFWLYPAHISDAAAPDILITKSWEAAERTLLAGGKVLYTPRLADLAWDSPPLARLPVFWNALMGPTWSRMLGLWCDARHPALAGFPTEANCDWQWTALVGNARAINLDRLPGDLKPIVSAIDDWNRNYKLGVIFEATVGTGKPLVCAIDLDDRPGAQALRRSLLDYMAGGRFAPATTISLEAMHSLFFDNLIMSKLGATVTADRQEADELVDGDPNTFWCSADAHGNGLPPPHVFQVDFTNAVPLNGLVLMPRQNQREHQGDIRDYTLEASEDGNRWQLVVRGRLNSTFDPQTIDFGRTLTATHLRLTDLSGFGRDQAGALAEIAVLYAGPKLPENQGTIEYQHIRTASTDIDAGTDAPKPQKQ